MNGKMTKREWFNIKLGYYAQFVYLGWVWAIMRYMLYRIRPTEFHDYGEYGGPDHYQGWIDCDKWGCVAFKRGDGALQFRW